MQQEEQQQDVQLWGLGLFLAAGFSYKMCSYPIIDESLTKVWRKFDESLAKVWQKFVKSLTIVCQRFFNLFVPLQLIVNYVRSHLWLFLQQFWSSGLRVAQGQQGASWEGQEERRRTEAFATWMAWFVNFLKSCHFRCHLVWNMIYPMNEELPNKFVLQVREIDRLDQELLSTEVRPNRNLVFNIWLFNNMGFLSGWPQGVASHSGNQQKTTCAQVTFNHLNANLPLCHLK